MKKVVIKILQGSVVTQTVLGGLAKYDSWLPVDKVTYCNKKQEAQL